MRGEITLNVRQAVVFAILMQSGDGIMSKHPSYVLEKVRLVEDMSTPELVGLDANNKAIFDRYRAHWCMPWDAEKELRMPSSELDDLLASGERPWIG